jgi:preprotein translocase subunit SecG
MAITLVLIVHTLLAAALVAVILLQRSEGGGLGIGGGTGGGLVSARGAADLMTRSTTIIAGLFVVTSLVLAMLYGQEGKTRRIDASAVASHRILDTAPAPTAPATVPLGAGLVPPPAPAPAAPAPAVPLAK